MTKYELPKEELAQFADFQEIAKLAATATADALTKDLIAVFEQRAQFFTLCERWDYAQGVQDCIDHLSNSWRPNAILFVFKYSRCSLPGRGLYRLVVVCYCTYSMAS